MSALGVPTTRALAAVASGETVTRETRLPGGIFTRVARSHIRIGTFQWFAARQDHDNLRQLADYVINRHYPEAARETNPYRSLLEGVIKRQADLIAHWMQLGFIHGVMNTDNMSVSGDTIDYGPCAFLDRYHPEKKFSSIDQQGRYGFSNQGPIGQWNLTRFAETLLPLINSDPHQAVAEAEAALDRFADLHQESLQQRFTAKIGLESGVAEDWELVKTLLSAMADGEADFTLVFRHLSDALESGDDQAVICLFQRPESITAWLKTWRSRLSSVEPRRAVDLMRRSNPVYIPRNHRVEEVIRDGCRGDFAAFHRLHEVLQHPFTVQAGDTAYEAAPAPEEVVQATFCGT